MTWRVLISAPYMQEVLEDYRSVFAERDIELVVPPVSERLSEVDLLDWVGGIDGVICGDDEFTERVFDAAPKLRVISKWGTGIDSIDQEAAELRGIAVRNTPGAFTDPVADSVLGYMLCFARRIPWMDNAIRANEWRKPKCISLAECTLGVIGVGSIGKAVVRRAVVFGMRVLGHDVVEQPADFLEQTGLRICSKAEMLREADFVSLNCDLNPSSYHIVGREELSLMKSSAVLINTARGPVVDEHALADALEQRGIAGAALDVFEVEPLPQESPLRRLDNVLLSPHNANSSHAARLKVHENTIANLLKVLDAV